MTSDLSCQWNCRCARCVPDGLALAPQPLPVSADRAVAPAIYRARARPLSGSEAGDRDFIGIEWWLAGGTVAGLAVICV
jgi:hypothetical protein